MKTDQLITKYETRIKSMKEEYEKKSKQLADKEREKQTKQIDELKTEYELRIKSVEDEYEKK